MYDGKNAFVSTQIGIFAWDIKQFKMGDFFNCIEVPINLTFRGLTGVQLKLKLAIYGLNKFFKSKNKY